MGDWVVGTGSSNSPIGDVSGKVVYVMRVTERLTMGEYDSLTQAKLNKKIPDVESRDPRRVVGDSLYDFSEPGIPQRPGVHDQGNRDTDLGGLNVLLSDEFLYFGDHPIALPTDLLPIVKQGQGHRSHANDPYLGSFADWIGSLGSDRPALIGQPQMWCTLAAESLPRACARARREEAEADLAGCDGQSK